MEGTWENPGADIHPPAFLAGARGSRSRVTDCEGPGPGAHIPAGVPVTYRKHNEILPQRRKCAVRMCNYSSRMQTKPLSSQSSLEPFITRPGAAAQPRCGAAWLHLVPPYSRRPLGCWHCAHTQHWLGPHCGPLWGGKEGCVQAASAVTSALLQGGLRLPRTGGRRTEPECSLSVGSGESFPEEDSGESSRR